MAIHLVVTRHFGPYKPGDRITDEAVIASIRASSNHACAVAVSKPVPEPPIEVITTANAPA